MDRQFVQRLAQTAGGFRDEWCSEIAAEMEHVLAFIRFQSAHQDDDAFVMLLAQPAGEGCNVEAVLRRSELPYRRVGKIFGIRREGFFKFGIQMERLFSIPVGESPLPGMIAEKAGLLDGLGCSRPTELGRAIRGDRDQRPRLIECLDDRGQKLRCCGAAGSDDRTRLGGFHRPPKGEKSSAAFLEMPPNTDQPGGFGTGQRLQQRRVSGTGTDDELAHARPEAAFYHIHRRLPCIHAGCANAAERDCPNV